jgi:hypothetical protein
MKFIFKNIVPPLTPYIGYTANNIGKSIQGIPLDKFGTKPDYAMEVLSGLAGIKTKPANMSILQYKLFKEYQYAVGQGYKGTFQEFQLAQKAAGAQKLTVDMTSGQKGFENELTLKKTFAAEPVYKAFNEMQSAYGQITDSLKAESPAGDLAAATKFMKLLDPGSVVRESELGMAMAASGALDRLTNLAQMRIKGTKLTPTQRKDFEKLSTDLFSTATATYNSKRNEFEQMGNAYNLNANRALGAPAKLPGKNIKVDY